MGSQSPGDSDPPRRRPPSVVARLPGVPGHTLGALTSTPHEGERHGRGQQAGSGTGRGGSGPRTAAGADRLDREARGTTALRGGGERRRRSLLPVLGQRRLRRPALRPRPHLHPTRGRAGAADRTARRGGDDPAPADAGPRPVQPRPARAGRPPRHCGRQAGQGPRVATDPCTAGRPRLLAGPGGPATQVGAGRPAAAEAQGRQDRRDGRRVRGRHHPPRRHRGCAVRLVHHPRRGDGRQRARRRDDLVPRQRPPHRQGDVRLRDHGPGGQGGRGQRPPEARADHRRRLDDLVLGRPRPAGELPLDGIGR